MNKKEFLSRLEHRLSGLPREEREERLSFYSEMIDDRIEEGLSEEEAVNDIGSIDEVADGIKREVRGSSQISTNNKSKKGIGPKAVTAIAIGSPLWIALGASAFAIIFSLFAAIWSVVISLWAVFISLAVSAPATLIMGIVYAIISESINSGLMFSAAFLSTGLAILFFFAAKILTAGSAILTKNSTGALKNLFYKKG